MSTRLKTKRRLAIHIAGTLPLAGCITVRPPDKPIQVNLNVDIRQEVSVKLQQDVQDIIRKNPQAFPSAPTTKK